MESNKKKLKEVDTIQCLSCLSRKIPIIKNNRVICPECELEIQVYLNMNFASENQEQAPN